MALKPYQRGADWSGARPSFPDVSQYLKFFIRYSAGAFNTDPKYQWKLCGKTEIPQGVRNGMDFLANSEAYTSRVLEGAAAGDADGQADLAFWKSRGYAKGALIIPSLDPGPGVPVNLSRAAYKGLCAYLAAYQKALEGYYTGRALYAGDVTLKQLFADHVIDYGWRCMSDSWSNDGNYYQPGSVVAAAKLVAKVSPAHLWQTGNRYQGNDLDQDVILRVGLPSHLAANNQPQPQPQPKPKPVPQPKRHGTYKVKAGDTFWSIEADHGWKHGTLARYNPGVHARNLTVGEVLKTPVKSAPHEHHHYVIRPGDTFFSIENFFHLRHGVLKRMNPGKDPRRLQIGDLIRIP